MTETRKILAAIGDDGLVKKLKKVFNGNLEIVQNGGEAVNQFNKGGYPVVMLDYLVAGNAVQAAIKIGAFSSDVKIIGYRWEKDFEGMLTYKEKDGIKEYCNMKSERSLVKEICESLGANKTYAQNIAEKFDDSDKTPQPVKR